MPTWAYLLAVTTWSFAWGFLWCWVVFRAAFRLGQTHPIIRR
jgi:hypothetical protein